MDINEVERLWGKQANKFVWSTRPTYVFEPDGSELSDLEPVPAVLDEHYDDESSWWTCHKDTQLGDLAVIYRNGRPNEPGDDPKHGPKDLRYIVLATTDAFKLTEEDDAGEFVGYSACKYVPVATFDPPVTLAEMKADDTLSSWSALRASFVKAAMPMPEDVWQRLLELASKPTSAGAPQPSTRTVTPEERRQTEHELETWIQDHPEHLTAVLGFEVDVIDRQLRCTEHNGIIDLLVRRRDRPSSVLALELKAGAIRRDALAQVLGYVGWLDEQDEWDEAHGVVIGLEQHDQVPYVHATVENLVTLLHWDDLPLPEELRARLTS